MHVYLAWNILNTHVRHKFMYMIMMKWGCPNKSQKYLKKIPPHSCYNLQLPLHHLRQAQTPTSKPPAKLAPRQMVKPLPPLPLHPHHPAWADGRPGSTTITQAVEPEIGNSWRTRRNSSSVPAVTWPAWSVTWLTETSPATVLEKWLNVQWIVDLPVTMPITSPYLAPITRPDSTANVQVCACCI